MGDVSDTVMNLIGKLDVFLITNGRSTSNYAIRNIENQKSKFRFEIIRDMSWLDANIEITKRCTAPFFVRVDDDMILHSRAIEFMFAKIQEQSNKVAMRGWRLWEPFSDKVIKGIKVYNLEAVEKIRFRLNDLGKIDKCFNVDSRQKGYVLKWHDDVLGIHSCAGLKENMKYIKMRGENQAGGFKDKKKWLVDTLKNFRMTLDEQASLASGFIEKKNKKKNTDFSRYIEKR